MTVPLLLPSIAVAFFVLGCIVAGTVCALRRDPVGTIHRLNDALAESAALRKENNLLRSGSGKAAPTGEGSRS